MDSTLEQAYRSVRRLTKEYNDGEGLVSADMSVPEQWLEDLATYIRDNSITPTNARWVAYHCVTCYENVCRVHLSIEKEDFVKAFIDDAFIRFIS